MKGHHIYTSSWFEFGSLIKNPGTFTVEFTCKLEGINNIIDYKLNPGFAAIPNELMTYNSDKSVFRLHHPDDDVTFASRTWYLNDQITGRGAVSYSYSLVFEGNDNRAFLKNPGAAFDSSYYEPYELFVRRAENPEKPSEVPDDYKYGDAKPKACLDGQEQLSRMGILGKGFDIFYISLYRAIVSGEENDKVAIRLPEGISGEDFICAILDILPLRLKRRFGAISDWVGRLDNGSKALSGIQLVCYQQKEPLSDHNTPIFYVEGQSIVCKKGFEESEEREYIKEYADFSWNDAGTGVASFEDFLENDFLHKDYDRVIDTMRFEHIAAVFALWHRFRYSGKVQTLMDAAEGLDIIARMFAKSINKRKFIKEAFDKCLLILSDNIKFINDRPVDAGAIAKNICMFAQMGFEGAEGIIKPLFDEVILSANPQNIEPIADYCVAKLGNPDIPDDELAHAIDCLYACLDLYEGGKPYKALLKYCFNLKNKILACQDRVHTGNLACEYAELSQKLNGCKSLPRNFFSLNDIDRSEPWGLYLVEKCNIEDLNYTPDIGYWDTVGRKIASLDNSQKIKLFQNERLKREKKDPSSLYSKKLEKLFEEIRSDFFNENSWQQIIETLDTLDILEVDTNVPKPQIGKDVWKEVARRADAVLLEKINRIYSSSNALDTIKKVDNAVRFNDFFNSGIKNGDSEVRNERLRYSYDPSQPGAIELAVAIVYYESGGSFEYGDYLEIRKGYHDIRTLEDLEELFEIFSYIEEPALRHHKKELEKFLESNPEYKNQLSHTHLDMLYRSSPVSVKGPEMPRLIETEVEDDIWWPWIIMFNIVALLSFIGAGTAELFVYQWGELLTIIGASMVMFVALLLPGRRCYDGTIGHGWLAVLVAFVMSLMLALLCALLVAIVKKGM